MSYVYNCAVCGIEYEKLGYLDTSRYTPRCPPHQDEFRKLSKRETWARHRSEFMANRKKAKTTARTREQTGQQQDGSGTSGEPARQATEAVPKSTQISQEAPVETRTVHKRGSRIVSWPLPSGKKVVWIDESGA